MTFLPFPTLHSLLDAEANFQALSRAGPAAGGPKLARLATDQPGWIVADGRAVTDAHPALRKALVADGYRFGRSGDNPLVPDLRGRVVIGAGSGPGLTPRAVGATGGEERHQLTVDEMPAHAHEFDRPAQFTLHGSGSGLPWNLTQDAGVYFATKPTGGDRLHNNMQPFVALNVLIKT